MAKQLGKAGKTATSDGEDKTRQAEIAGNVTQETFLQSCKEMADVNAKVKAVNEERKRVRKTVKARGLELGDVDATLRMADWSREEVSAKFDRARQYALWLGLPIGVQPDLFKGMTAEQKEQYEWHARGATDAKAGKSGMPPEDCPDDLRDYYARGFKGKALEKTAKAPKGPKTDADGNIVARKPTAAEDAEFEKGGAADPAFN